MCKRLISDLKIKDLDIWNYRLVSDLHFYSLVYHYLVTILVDEIKLYELQGY